MAAKWTHAEYEASLPVWGRARDVLSGEDAVKAAGERYLPRMDSQRDGDYSAYKARAAFFGATTRTLEEYLDLVFRRAPAQVLGTGDGMRKFAADCDLSGLAFARYARLVVSEVLSVGRVGSLVMWDESGRPVVSLWRAEEILNWETERVGGRDVLSRVVLSDGDQVRVLRTGSVESVERGSVERGSVERGSVERGTNGTNGTDELRERVCVMEKWRRGSDGSEWALAETVPLVRDGKPVPFVPFVFHGPRHARPEPDRLPLADIIAANLDHYRLDADYKHGLHLTVLPTAWVVGVESKKPLTMGTRAAWTLDGLGGSAGFLEYGGAGLAHVARAIEKVEQRMRLLGARMTTGVVANEAESGGDGGEMCGLGSIVAALNESLSRVLQIASWWIHGGEVSAQAARFVMNTDLGAQAMRGEEINAVVAAWRSGAISRETMLERLKRGEVLPDGRSVEREKALIYGKVEG